MPKGMPSCLAYSKGFEFSPAGRGWSALTATRAVIHYRPVRIPFNRIEKQKHHLSVMLFFFGCRLGIRTPTNRVRVCRATVTQFGNVPRTHYSIASTGAFVKIFFKKIENFPPDFSARRKNPSRRLQRCINVVK